MVLTQARLFGLSPNYFQGQAQQDLWPGMANVCYCCKLNNMLNVGNYVIYLSYKMEILICIKYNLSMTLDI